jgi:hypothetical protein
MAAFSRRWPGGAGTAGGLVDFILVNETIVDIVSDFTYIVLFTFTLISLLNQLIRVEISDFNIICGAVACYLLIGTTWALSYHLIETIEPGSIAFTGDAGNTIFADYLYFSFTTMT